jgi:hypothetical protein
MIAAGGILSAMRSRKRAGRHPIVRNASRRIVIVSVASPRAFA